MQLLFQASREDGKIQKGIELQKAEFGLLVSYTGNKHRQVHLLTSVYAVLTFALSLV
ncbi:hypothetical protein [Ectobacillus funiculus]|uniref:hypothetical protein n=1 Tax=Ectobacillus funiculus TaxID=137993 RepID=UPI00196AA91F|nr:hypothetical protein [Ectobacillus funiculus]